MLPRHNNGFLTLGTASVPYVLRRSRRRRTLGLTVTTEHVRIHAPSWTPRAEIDYYVQQQQSWLQRTWTRVQAEIAVANGAQPTQLMYLGRKLALQFHDSLFAEVRRSGQILHIYAPALCQSEVLRDWLQMKAGRILASRLTKMARKLGRTPTRFALSNARTQWGSCTRDGSVRLSWRLVQAPLTLIDYVAAHELAHLVHLDHSPSFWALVARLCPDMISRRASLQKMSIRLFLI